MAKESIKKILVSVIVALSLVSFTGCASKCPAPEIQYVDRVVEVEIPVAVMPSIPKIVKPELPIKKLKKNASAKEVVEAYYNSLKLQINYSKSLEKILAKFNEVPKNGTVN